MLTIRDSQLNVLGDSAFERWLVQHVSKCIPEYAQKVGNDQLPSLLRKMRERAARYFRSESGICMFVDLACLLGENFDEDPRLPWAHEILTKLTIHEEERARLLYQKARSHLRRPGSARTAN